MSQFTSVVALYPIVQLPFSPVKLATTVAGGGSDAGTDAEELDPLSEYTNRAVASIPILLSLTGLMAMAAAVFKAYSGLFSIFVGSTP